MHYFVILITRNSIQEFICEDQLILSFVLEILIVKKKLYFPQKNISKQKQS